jgi:hypothetical protein
MPDTAQPDKKNLAPKILTISAFGIILGFGTCGLIASNNTSDKWIPLAIFGRIVCGISAFVLVITLLVMLIEFHGESFRK